MSDTREMTREDKMKYIFDVSARTDEHRQNETYRDSVIKRMDDWSDEKIDKLFKDHFGADMRIVMAVGRSFILNEGTEEQIASMKETEEKIWPKKN